MRKNRDHKQNRHSLIVFVVIVTAFAFYPLAARAQWTTNGNDINNSNTGNVGVRTSTPEFPLQVNNSTSNILGMVYTGTLSATSGAGIQSLTLTTPSAADQRLGFYTFGARNAGTSYNPVAIQGFSSQAWTLGSAQGGYMTFSTTPNDSATRTERMRIDPNGFVGIGTTTPAYRLDVGGSVNASSGLCIAGDCKTAWSQVGGGGSSQWTTSGSTIYYNTGNVGIGLTNAPTRKLEVLGGNIYHQWSTTAGSEYGFYTAINNNHFTSNLYFDGQWKMITAGKGAFISAAPFSGSAFSVVADNTSRAANAAASFASLLSVTMGGNVGVGTAAPDPLAKLHVYGSGGFGQDIQTATNDWTRVRLVTPVRTWGFFLDGGAGALGAGNLGLYDYTANAWRMLFDTTGKIGIGTNTPTTTLDVNGTVNATALTVSGNPVVGSQWTTTGTTINYTTGNVGVATASPTEKLHVTGNVKVTGNIDVGGNINAKYQDVAEWVDSSQVLSAGTVVVLDPTKSNQVIASSQSYDSRVAGVISLQPGVALGERGEGRVLVATTGRVKVRVDATNGPIQIGDLLVTSEKEGIAMKSVPVEIGGVRIHRPGTLIGKALESLSQGTGEILVLLSLQ